MIVFCEECGKKHHLSFSASDGKIKKIVCQRCHDTITVHKPMPGITNGAPDEIAVNFRQIETPKKRLRLLVVDDSKMFRRIMRDMFEAHHLIEIVGEAENGVEALEMIPELDPDVITLDVNMPVMSGLTTLKYIMIKNPKPTVMFSALTQEGAQITFDALKFGAIDFIPKPSRVADVNVEQQQQDIIKKVVLAANVQIQSVRVVRPKVQDKIESSLRNLPPLKHVYALGAGEGGYGALLKMIPKLDAQLPMALLVVLYCPESHLMAFVNYLNQNSAIRVQRGRDGDIIESGRCYLIYGGEYAIVEGNRKKSVLKVHPSPFPSRRGAINMLMFSIAEKFTTDVIGMVLTGSGIDGVEGLNEIHRLGGLSIVQDPGSCLSKEMAESAINNCKIDAIVPDTMLASKVNELSSAK